MRKGDAVFIRTVTHYYVGRVVTVNKLFVTLKDASWVADTGRWYQALKYGTLNEIEPFIDPVDIAIGSIVDVTKWRHPLPTEQK